MGDERGGRAAPAGAADAADAADTVTTADPSDAPLPSPRSVGRAEVVLLGTVLGLVSEGDRAEAAVRGLAPDVVAVGVSPGELDALLSIARGEVGDDVEIPVSSVDTAYARALSRFGRVELPPPSYLAAVRAARRADLALEALDLEEEAYTTAFTEHVGAFDLIRKGRREKRLAKRGVEADDPTSLAQAWEDAFLRIGGLRDLEAHREAHMADRLRELGDRGGRVLAVVASVREAGIAERLWPDQAGEPRGGGGLGLRDRLPFL